MSEPRILYFGCLKRVGHYVWENDSPPRHIDKDDSLRQAIEIMDAALPPQFGIPVEGEVVFHDILGFAVVAWWDNSIDKRPKSNSVFWVEGEHSAEEALRLGLERFPTVAARITYPFTFKEDGKQSTQC